jgi:flagellar protein FliS
LRGLRGYARTRIESASNEDVLVMLLEGAVDRCRQARAAIESGDRNLWNKHLHTVRAIFLELQMALDPAGSPELLTHLRNTYAWILHHSTETAKTGDLQRLHEVQRVVEVMYTTWSQAVVIAREGTDDSAEAGE